MVWLLASAVVFALGATLRAEDKTKPQTKPEVVEPVKPKDALLEDARILQMLNEPANVGKVLFGGAPVDVVLDYIATQKEMLIRVDQGAFEKLDPDFWLPYLEMRRDVRAMAPPLADVLQDVIANFDPPAAYVIKQGMIEIVPQEKLANGGLLKDKIRMDVVSKQFDDTVMRLASMTGASVVIDPRLGEKAKASVSGIFRSVPLQTAVVALADLIDVRVIAIDNVLYVTTKENATLNELEIKRRGELPPR
jgi:hypothetical protein